VNAAPANGAALTTTARSLSDNRADRELWPNRKLPSRAPTEVAPWPKRRPDRRDAPTECLAHHLLRRLPATSRARSQGVTLTRCHGLFASVPPMRMRCRNSRKLDLLIILLTAVALFLVCWRFSISRSLVSSRNCISAPATADGTKVGWRRG